MNVQSFIIGMHETKSNRTLYILKDVIIEFDITFKLSMLQWRNIILLC